MKRTVQSVKNSLKFKAQPKAGILSVRIGVKKYAVPIEARMINGGNFLFLSFPGSSELYQIENKDLRPISGDETAAEAFTALNPVRRRGRRRTSKVEMPPELEQALRALPAGYKLGYNADGSPKLVRARTRTKREKAS